MEATETVKKEYEIAFLVRDEVAVEDLVRLLSQHQAEIKSEAPLRRIALAYKIKKESAAYFGVYQFEAQAEQVKALEHDLRISSSVIRALIVKHPSKAPGERPRTGHPRPASEKKAAAPALSNEALEKKIEEILQ